MFKDYAAKYEYEILPVECFKFLLKFPLYY